jgi:hypothetical protein
VTRARRRSTRAPRCVRARRTASPRWQRSGSSASCASATASTPAAGSSTTTSRPRRPPHFLPRKVTRGAAAIALGRQETLELGSLDAVRDWCHAADVARPPGSCSSTTCRRLRRGVGGRRTVGDLVEAAFAAAGIASEGRESRSTRSSCARPRPPRRSVTPHARRCAPRVARGDRLRGHGRGDGRGRPRRLRRYGLSSSRSARVMSRMRSSNVVVGFQPSTRSALS